MKKIVSALALTAVAASFATADVTVKINSRTRPSLYTSSETYADDSKASTVMDFSYADHKDDLTLSAKGENAGITAKITLQNDKAGYTLYNEKPNGTVKGQTIKLDGEYYGWMTFGGFKLTAGQFDSRYVNRYNKSAIEEGLTDSDTAKYGVSNSLIIGVDNPTVAATAAHVTLGKSFLYDFNNVSAIAGTRVTSLFGDYTIEGVGDGKVLLKAGALANDFSSFDEAKTDYSRVGAGFVGEVTYDSSAFIADFILKLPSQHALGFGTYIDIKAVENLNLAFGLTYGKVSEYDYWDGAAVSTQPESSALAFDARAFYQVSDPLLVGLQAKYSQFNQDDLGENDQVTGLELVATAQYKVNDLLTAQFDLGYYNEDLGNNLDAEAGQTQIKVRPGVKISASSAAAVTAAVEYTTRTNDGDVKDLKAAKITKSSIAIPLIVRVKL